MTLTTTSQYIQIILTLQKQQQAFVKSMSSKHLICFLCSFSFFPASSPASQSEESPARYMITVLNPQKMGGKNTYVAYEVTAQATFGEKETLVSVRRYSDFLWLHDQLRNHNRSTVIPPIPEKSLSLSLPALLSSL